jgi:dsDNA-specific endonuclease/ATPase MutS2
MNNDTVFFASSIDGNISILDLHIYNDKQDALSALEHFLLDASKQKLQYAKIVYGIGEGKLRQSVLDALLYHPLLSDVRETDEGGSCIVIF